MDTINIKNIINIMSIMNIVNIMDIMHVTNIMNNKNKIISCHNSCYWLNMAWNVFVEQPIVRLYTIFPLLDYHPKERAAIGGSLE